MTDDIIIRIRDLKTAYGTHVVHEHLDLDIRRAGLDIDPGWLPWLGRVVRFRYE